MRCSKFLIATMLAAGINSVAYAAEKYELTNYSVGTICNDLLSAIKASGVADMDEPKLCKLRNSPDGVVFAGKKIINLKWTPYETLDKFKLAKELFENSIPKSDLPRFHDSEELYLREIQTLIAEDSLRIITAPVEIGGKKLWVVMLQKSRCNDGSTAGESFPVYGFFTTSDLSEQVISSPPGNFGAGQLIYIGGFPATLSVDPFWGPPNTKHPVLVVALMSVNYSGNTIFNGDMCNITITK
jgi:hypothetical protein